MTTAALLGIVAAPRTVSVSEAAATLPMPNFSCIHARVMTGCEISVTIVSPMVARVSSAAPAAHSRFHVALVCCICSHLSTIANDTPS